MMNSDPNAWGREITQRWCRQYQGGRNNNNKKTEGEEADGKDKRQKRKGKIKGPHTLKKKKGGEEVPHFRT